MATANFQITSLSSTSVTPGATLTIFGEGLSQDVIATFTPTAGGAPVTASPQSGSEASVTIIVPEVATGAYTISLTTTTDGSTSNPLDVEVTTSMGNGAVPDRAVVDADSFSAPGGADPATTSMGNGHVIDRAETTSMGNGITEEADMARTTSMGNGAVR